MPESMRLFLRFIQLSQSLEQAAQKNDPTFNDVHVCSEVVYDMRDLWEDR